MKKALMIVFCGAVVLMSGCKACKPPNAQNASVTGAKIVAFGLVAPDITAETNAPETSLGFIHTGKRAELLKTTDVIEAKVGTSFGIFYCLDGQPTGNSVHALIQVAHPKIINPETKKPTEVEKWDVVKHIGWTGCSFWTFDHDWEIAPGQWQFRVIYDSKVLAERAFTVRRPE